MQQKKVYTVAILAYPGMTMLDAIGPNEVLANSPYFDVTWVSTQQDPVVNDVESFALNNLQYFKQLEQADILLVPGGPGDKKVMEDKAVIDWIKKIDTNTLLTTSVCSGALILAEAGLLANRQACTHWACLSELEKLGAISKRKRFTQSDKYITASGVSAGIDMALYLVHSLISPKHAKQLRFGIEYFPNQINIISTYTLPTFFIRKLADKVKHVIDRRRSEFA